ncbi:MAG: metallophosphoesterase N-terminal domain-containing protein [Muribaculaceae bacterium]
MFNFRKISAALLLSILALPALAGSPNITGTVTADGKPLAGVAVSDGCKIVLTDKKGRYAIDSRKKDGTVFVITPSGYYAPSKDNFQPAFWALLDKDVRKKEEHDFTLVPQNQDNFSILFATDIHIINEDSRDDLVKFQRQALPAIQQIAAEYRSRGPLFTVNLGDTSQDYYWYKNDMDLRKAVAFLAANNFPGPVYSVSGNHDNDGAIGGENVDERAAWQYRATLGPAAYSMNIGDTHWVMLDNVLYKNLPTEKKKPKGVVGDRSYDHGFTPEQIEWMKRDIALVPDSMKVFIGCHVPILSHFPGRETRLTDTTQFDQLNDIYSRFDNVTIVSGHTHKNHYRRSEKYPRFEQYIFLATSGNIWNTQPGSQLLGNDGSAGGVWVGEFADGKNPDIHFRGYIPGNEYFRAYDLNEVGRYYKHDYILQYQRTLYPDRINYADPKFANQIMVNFWDYTDGKTLEILEDGQPLEVKFTPGLEDPLYNISSTAPVNVRDGRPTGAGAPVHNPHMYIAQGRTANAPVEIRVRDANGNIVFTETLHRPKPFHRHVM